MTELHVHVPTPGDHYSPSTGSATMTVIYELARRHEAAGGATRIVVGEGTRHDYDAGECVAVPFPPAPSRRQKLADAARGRAGGRRRHGEAAYAAAAGAVDAEFTGPLVAHNAPAGIVGLKRRRPRARAVLYAHNDLFRTYGDRELLRTVDALDGIVCVSDYLRETIARRLPRNRRRLVRVARNGVDIDRFVPVPRDPGEPVILFVGRVVPYKGPDLVLRAAARIAGGGRRFRVRIVGSHGFDRSQPLSPYERKLRELAAPLGGIVEFQPFVDRDGVRDEYAGASIFCAPSTWDDPCPLIVGEALASGLATVTTRRGGIPETAGDAALYFDPRDHDQLAERLAFLVDDAGARDALGRRARERAEQLSWTVQYPRYVEAVEA